MTAEPEPAIANPEQQLAWEKRHRTRAAISAAVAAIGLLVFNVLQQVVNRDTPTVSGLKTLQRGVTEKNVDALPSLQTAALEHFHDKSAMVIVLAIAGFVGYLGLAWTVGFLGVAARSRIPTLRKFIVYIPIVGGVLLGVAVLMTSLGKLNAINTFLDSDRTVADAYDANRNGVVLYAGLLSLLGTLAVAVGVVLVALHAMRAGLLTRMLGYIGIASGAMMVFFALPIVQVFWFSALAFVFLGRWPGGELPAWAAGEAVPWPTPERPPPRQRRGAPAPASASEPGASSGSAPARRKRKKRN
ncbi:MAG TPA: hypothetical protein VI300_09440 [Solirubrobacter sp.]